MYGWVLFFHIISLISWMAALFYLPRLFVYHAENRFNNGFVDVVKVMEFKLHHYINVPAFWATLISGLWLIYLNPNIFSSGIWFYAKLFLVLLLVAFFLYLGVILKRFRDDECQKSGKFFRVLNEVPTLLMIGIVIMVIIKPF